MSSLISTVPFNLALSKTGSKITLDASGNGKINLLDIGMYEVFFTWSSYSITTARMAAFFIIRNPAGQVSTGPTCFNNGGSPQFTTSIYIPTAPSTIEFQALHYLGSDMRLGTSTLVGGYWTYASVLYLG